MSFAPPRRWVAVVGLLALAAVCGGCRVATTVSVSAGSDGRGAVSVAVSFDREAVSAIGGEAALASQLSDADLVAAGWTVSGPRPGAGGALVVTASHAFADLAQAGVLFGEVAGEGPPSTRPFRLAITRHDSFWRTETALSGTVDLRCGLDCFGDSGLTSALGSPTGVNARSLASRTGQQPGQVFAFSVLAELPGSVVRDNAIAGPEGSLRWTPQLGRAITLSALTRSWKPGPLIGLATAAGLAVIGVIAVLWRWVRRRRRRRQRGGRQHDRRRHVGRRRRGRPTSPAQPDEG